MFYSQLAHLILAVSILIGVVVALPRPANGQMTVSLNKDAAVISSNINRHVEDERDSDVESSSPDGDTTTTPGTYDEGFVAGMSVGDVCAHMKEVAIDFEFKAIDKASGLPVDTKGLRKQLSDAADDCEHLACKNESDTAPLSLESANLFEGEHEHSGVENIHRVDIHKEEPDRVFQVGFMHGVDEGLRLEKDLDRLRKATEKFTQEARQCASSAAATGADCNTTCASVFVARSRMEDAAMKAVIKEVSASKKDEEDKKSPEGENAGGHQGAGQGDNPTGGGDDDDDDDDGGSVATAGAGGGVTATPQSPSPSTPPPASPSPTPWAVPALIEKGDKQSNEDKLHRLRSKDRESEDKIVRREK